jgi:hypothetical protein
LLLHRTGERSRRIRVARNTHRVVAMAFNERVGRGRLLLHVGELENMPSMLRSTSTSQRRNDVFPSNASPCRCKAGCARRLPGRCASNSAIAVISPWHPAADAELGCADDSGARRAARIRKSRGERCAPAVRLGGEPASARPVRFSSGECRCAYPHAQARAHGSCSVAECRQGRTAGDPASASRRSRLNASKSGRNRREKLVETRGPQRRNGDDGGRQAVTPRNTRGGPVDTANLDRRCLYCFTDLCDAVSPRSGKHVGVVGIVFAHDLPSTLPSLGNLHLLDSELLGVRPLGRLHAPLRRYKSYNSRHTSLLTLQRTR